jgi:hypothetical protein
LTLSALIALPGLGLQLFGCDIRGNHTVPGRGQLAADLGADSPGASGDESEPTPIPGRRAAHVRSASHWQIAGGISFCDLPLT